jgi:hypothetical protein
MEKNIMLTITKEQLSKLIQELYFIETVVKESVANTAISNEIYYKKNCKYLNQLRNKLLIVHNDKSSI